MGGTSTQLKSIVEALPFVQNHSIEITHAEDGQCIARMPLVREHSSPPGIFPAAMVGMLGDVAGITACISALEPGLLCSTSDFTIKMTGIADGDTLEAHGKALSTGKNIVTGESRIYSIKNEQRKLCAAVLVTGRVTN